MWTAKSLIILQMCWKISFLSTGLLQNLFISAANGQAALGGLVAGQSAVGAPSQSGTNQNGPVLSNGHQSSSGAAQVFDYGHMSSNQFKRQKTLPNTQSGAQTHLQHVNKTSPSSGSLGPTKTFHGFNKLSPSLGNHKGHAKKMHGYAGTSTSPSSGSHLQQFSTSQHQSHSSPRKHSSHSKKFSKQHSVGHSHKYA